MDHSEQEFCVVPLIIQTVSVIISSGRRVFACTSSEPDWPGEEPKKGKAY